MRMPIGRERGWYPLSQSSVNEGRTGVTTGAEAGKVTTCNMTEQAKA